MYDIPSLSYNRKASFNSLSMASSSWSSKKCPTTFTNAPNASTPAPVAETSSVTDIGVSFLDTPV